MKKLLFRLAILIGFISHICADTVYEYQSACDNADIDGCYHLGLAYARGEGVKQDIELSRDYLQFSCDEGLSSACVALRSLTVRDEINNLEDKQNNSAKSKDNDFKITCLHDPEDKQDNRLLEHKKEEKREETEKDGARAQRIKDLKKENAQLAKQQAVLEELTKLIGDLD